MRTTCFLSIFLFGFISLTSAQTYTEIFEGGWGIGMAYCRPVFTDLDNDGLLDLIVGTFEGNLHHYEQEAAGSSDFSLISDSFSGIDVGEQSAPGVIDLDGDGRLDLIIGAFDGNLDHYEQDAIGSTSFSLVSATLSGINIGRESVPSFTDLDGNGLIDMIVGDYDGNLNHYEQNAAGSVVFSMVSETFSGIDVGRQSAACTRDLDNDGLLDMMIGEGSGNVNHYEQNGPGSTVFSLVTEDFLGIDIGVNSAPQFLDIDNDGLIDMVVGGDEGILHRYEQNAVGSMLFTNASLDIEGINVGRCSAPCIRDIDGNGRLDMIVGEWYGNINHYEQNAAGSSYFTLVSDNFNGISMGSNSRPCFTDLDNDGRLDMIIGKEFGPLSHYEQSGIASTTFNLVTHDFNDISVGNYSTPTFIDLDDDGRLDLIIGEINGNLNHYEQDGIGSSSFTLVTENFNSIDIGFYVVPIFTDLDDDDRLDLIVGQREGELHHYEQDAVGSLSFSEVTENFAGIFAGAQSAPCFADIDGDGLVDFIVGVFDGGIHYFRRNEDTGFEENNGHNLSYRLFPSYPNPFNPSTEIRFALPEYQKVNISIYNLRGQKLKVLTNGFMKSGYHSVNWDGRDSAGQLLASGVYVCRIQAGEYLQSIKLTLIR